MPGAAWIGLAVGMVMITATKMGGPPPVMRHLGPVVPTPAPTPKGGERKRLISTITVQNTPTGETIVSFEASDFADEGEGKTRPLASKRYSLADEKPELKGMANQILQHIRDLEHEMLTFAEKAGPPKERAPLNPADLGAPR